jgi:isoleucyl-tRNA synthetase
VVPRLLGLIDNTTNWYIRFNRKRLKGENGVADTANALDTLFEVLFTLCRGLAPFTPFITETIYQKLRPFIPEERLGVDARSVHFLPFPDVREELFDADIERRVGRMQKVIELGRISRERRTMGLKTPLKTLVVIHRDPEYLADVETLASYIKEELNVQDLVLTSDEDQYNVQYTAVADWPVLGKKLKKDMGRVKKGLATLTSQDVKNYLLNGTIDIDGIKLDAGDLVVRRELKESEATSHFETNTDNDVLILLDMKQYPGLAEEGLAREIINRVQRLRKKAGLVPTDDVRMEYHVVSDPENIGLEGVFSSHGAALEKALRRPLDKHTATRVDGEIPAEKEEGIIAEEETDIQHATVLLRLLHLK